MTKKRANGEGSVYKTKDEREMMLPTPNPMAPATAKVTTLFQLLRARPKAAPPHAPPKKYANGDGYSTHSGGGGGEGG